MPVRLSLRNFLSYGEDAPELDFEAFHVACLSGGNGQGKSALLDAITWALWGEARKAGGKPKPDDEILRVGAREMEVVFTFDLGAERYRVLRRYALTAGGTGKPTLEFQAYDAASGTFEPLTAPTLSATQARITERLGLDHETFVNSTFLLQGRSDEFTRKSAGDRKKILGKILGLGRYEALEERARLHQAAAREDVARLAAAEARLRDDLADEPRWRAEHAAAEAAVAALGAERDALEAARRRAETALARLEGAQREAEAHREALRDLRARQARARDEIEDLARRLAQAEALIARAADIEADHAAYEAAAAARRALDQTRALFDGLQHQHRALAAERDAGRRALERRIERLALELEQHRRRRAELTRELEARPRLEKALRAAEAAEKTRARLAAVRQRRAQLQGRLDALEKRLAAARGTLEGRVASLRKQLDSPAPDPAALRDALGRAEARVRTLEEHEAATERVKEEGSGLRETIARLTAERDALDAEIAAVEERRVRLRETTEGRCPTCGATLDAAHRRKVDAEYRAEIARLERLRQAHEAALREAAQRRDTLGQEYRRHRAEAEALAPAREARARLSERLERVDRERAEAARARRELADLQRRLEEEAFEPAAQAEATALRDELAEVDFDEAAYEEAARQAATLPRLRQDEQALAEKAAAADDLQAAIARDEAALAGLRADLDAGTPYAEITARLAELERQQAALGYDPARHEAVAAEAERLAGA
ncbi:MAG: AAA family ATPase, partial [Rubricoccaceae bacterium]